MSILRELDNRKMRDRDASLGNGDRGNAPDADTLRDDTSDMGLASGQVGAGRTDGGNNSGGADDEMGANTGGSSAADMGTSTGSGGNWSDPGSTTGSGLGENTSTNDQSWDQPGTDTRGGMDRTVDTASGNWGDSSGLSDNAAGPGAGDWVSGDNNTGYKDPDKNR